MGFRASLSRKASSTCPSSSGVSSELAKGMSGDGDVLSWTPLMFLVLASPAIVERVYTGYCRQTWLCERRDQVKWLRA